MSLQGTKTILAITGGIAAFKALGVLRLLKQHGADVYVVMSEHATHFLTPASCAMVSGHPVSVDLFAPLKTWEMEHIALAHGAELVLVAPATANCIAKLTRHWSGSAGVTARPPSASTMTAATSLSYGT